MKLLKKIKTFFEEKLNFYFYKDKFGWRNDYGNPHIREVSVEHRWFNKVKRFSLSFVIGKDGEDTISIQVSIPWLFNIYFCVNTRYYKWLPDYSRRTELTICSTGIFWYLWHDDIGFSKGIKGWNDVYGWMWILCGYCDNKRVSKADGTPDCNRYTLVHDLPPFIGHPDGVKDAVFTVIVEKWEQTYPNRWYMRWYRKPFTRTEVFTPHVKIMVPGKGENSWDQDDEEYGTVSFGMHTTSINAAVEEYCNGITKYMKR